MDAQKKPVSCSNLRLQCGQLSYVLLNSNGFSADEGNTLPVLHLGHLQVIIL